MSSDDGKASDEVRKTFSRLASLDTAVITLDADRSAWEEQLQLLQQDLKIARTAGQLGVRLITQRDLAESRFRKVATELDRKRAEIDALKAENEKLKAALNAVNASSDAKALATKVGSLESTLKEKDAVIDKLKKAQRKRVNFGKSHIEHVNNLEWENSHLMNLHKTALKGKSGKIGKKGSVTLRRKAMREESNRIVREDAEQWVSEVLGRKFNNFVEELKDGVVLCEVILKIDPNLIKKLHRNASPGSFLAHDNAHMFTKACSKLGVREHQICHMTDIASGNARAICYCILALSRAATQFGIKPSPLVKMEMEIDRIKATRAAHTVKIGEVPASLTGTGDINEEPKEYIVVQGDEVDKAVADVCSEYGIINPPLRLAEGEYRFGHKVVFVRMHQGTALVRHDDKWQDLKGFVRDCIRDEVIDKSNAENSDSSNPLVETKKIHVNVTVDNRKKPEPGSGVEIEEIDEEEVRAAYNANAYKEFFYLTALSVKLNHNLKEEDVCLVSTDVLFRKAIDDNVPFHNFASWIDNELTKAYLEKMVTTGTRERVASVTGTDGLRGARRRTMGLIRARQNKFVAPTVEDEEDEGWFSYWFG